MTNCPSEDCLRALLAEALTPPEVAAVEAHLADCPPCQKHLERLTTDPATEQWRRLAAHPAHLSGQRFVDCLYENAEAVGLFRSASGSREAPESTFNTGLPVSAPSPAPNPSSGRWPLLPTAEQPETRAARRNPALPERIGRFAVKQLLGEGGFGRVYLAHDEQLDREVAIKVAKPEALKTSALVKRFLREARAAAQLRHPGIVPLFEANRDNDSYYLASAFIIGRTLADTMAQGEGAGGRAPDAAPGRKLGFRRTAQLVRELAEALAYAHGQGIVHRDVKPANVMVDERGQPLLMDFGLAMRLDEAEKVTHDGAVLGTPRYMAPEQAAGRSREVGPASDQYSLGVILYEMLCGKHLFKGGVQAVLNKHIHEEPVPPRGNDRRIPRDLETICLKTLAKKPAERYPGCLELADDLRRFLDDEPIRARQATLLERTVKLARRNPTAARLTALTLLLLLVIGIGSVLYLSVENFRLHKTQDARAEVLGLLNQAEQYEMERRWAEADTALKRAQAVLRNQPDLNDKDLSQAIEQRLTGVQTQQIALDQAQDRQRMFWQHHDEGLFYWTPFTGLDFAANQTLLREAVRAALDLYGLAGDSAESMTVVLDRDRPHLATEEHTELGVACHELLLVWAEAEASGTPGARPTREQKQQQAQLALALLERGERLGQACGLKTRTHLLRKARYEAWARGEVFTPTREQQAASQPESALDWFQVGLERYRAGQFKAGATALEETLRLDPRHFWARYVQSLCHLQDGQWADGRAALTVCLQQRPKFVWARLLRGFAAGKLAARDGGLYTVARVDLNQALQQDSSPLVQYVGLVNRGVLFIQQQQWPEAIADLHEAIRRKDDGYQGYLNLAQAYQGAKQRDEAMAVLSQAIDKAPQLAVLYEARARLHRERKDAAAARADFEKAISLELPGNASPRLAGVLVELGRLLEASGDAAAALERYDQVLKVQPDFALAHRCRAEALLALKRRGEAAAALERHLKLEPKPSVQAYRARGLLHAQEGNYAAAVEMYTQALRLKPDDAATRCDRGWAYLLQDAARPALADFETALHHEPKSVEALLGRGNARVRLRQVAEAVADAEAADKAGTLDERQLYNLTCIYALAVAQLELDIRNKADRLTARQITGIARQIALCEEKGLDGLKRTLDKVTLDQRSTFWRQRVQNDPALTALRRGAGYSQLAARYGRPGL